MFARLYFVIFNALLVAGIIFLIRKDVFLCGRTSFFADVIDFFILITK